MAAHQYACSILGIEYDKDATAVVIREAILTFAENDKEKDAKVRELVTNFVENDGDVPLNSQEDMFSPESYRTDTHSDSDEEDEEEENEIGKKDGSHETTSTPLRTTFRNQTPKALVASKLTDKIQSWIGKEGVIEKKDGDKKDELNEAIDLIETSFAALTVTEDDQTKTNSDKTENQDNVPQSTKTPDKCPTCRDFNFLLVESRKVIAFKDAQIETLDHYMSQKEAQLSKLEDMNRVLLNKLESVNTAFTTKTDEVFNQLQTQQKEFISEIRQTVSSEKIDRLAQAIENSENLEQAISTNENTKEWQENCQSIMLDMAKSIDNLENKLNQTQQVIQGSHMVSGHRPFGAAAQKGKTENKHDVIVIDDETEKQKEIIILGDSNTKHLIPKMVHHKKKVTIEWRPTVEKAISEIPKRQEPENVSDIVFMTALNDSKDKTTSVDTVVKRMKQACYEYRQRFKESKIHIAAVAPVGPKQRNLNRQLDQFAKDSGFSYISNDELLDENSKEVQSGVLDGIHYTKQAIPTVAKHLKRSLYFDKEQRKGSAEKNTKIRHNASDTINRRSEEAKLPNSSTEQIHNPTAGLMSAMESFFRQAGTMLSASPQSDNQANSPA